MLRCLRACCTFIQQSRFLATSGLLIRRFSCSKKLALVFFDVASWGAAAFLLEVPEFSAENSDGT